MMPRDAIEVRHHGRDGPSVVVLHGGPGAPGSAAGLARALADDFRVLEPLQRRSGGGAPLSVARHVADLAAVAPEHATLVGWSWGAMLALSYAAQHPERVRALALVGCGTYDLASRAAYRAAMDARLGATGRARIAALVARLSAATDDRARDEAFAEMGSLAGAAQGLELLDPPLDATADPLPPDARGHDETWQDVLRLQREGTEPAAFAAIRAPVLMLHGADDPHPGPATRDTLRRFVPQLEFVALPRCGHEPWRERHGREPFLRSLTTWLRAHAAA